MQETFSPPTFWLEFRLLNDGLQTAAVRDLPLTAWHAAHNPVFHRFAALPAELRLKVWEYLIAPRIVGIACLCQEDGAAPPEVQREDRWGAQPAVRPSVPVLLHVNRETRALALKHYELSFQWKVPRMLAGADLYPPVVAPRSPVLAAPAPAPAQPPSFADAPPGSSPRRLAPDDDDAAASLSHVSSYHDLLDPSPGNGTGGGGGGDERIASAAACARARAHAHARPEGQRTSSPARTWFNFALDAVYLVGELEPCDSFGSSSPMAYFIPSRAARRVRLAAVAFRALRYGEGAGGQQIFGALFHVADHFAPQPAGAARRVLVGVTPRDEWTHAMLGNETALVPAGGGKEEGEGEGQGEGENIVEHIWRNWYCGTVTRPPLRGLRFPLIPEADLERHVYDFMLGAPAKQTKTDGAKRVNGRVEE
ncbi:hypothetical protein F4802DRAFT_110793 [Xylaria palmicola]|nr:hypothetical protein F4802DRAFT_110793 [Xylaria palmicola]